MTTASGIGGLLRWALALGCLAALAVAPAATAAIGEARIQPRIVNGEPAPAGSWRSIVALVTAGQHPIDGQFCGGSLIAPRYVLTAAHCVDADRPEDVDVLLGTHDLDGGGGEMIDVEAITVHPEWNTPRMANDVAVLELAEPSDQPLMPLATTADDPSVGDPLRVAGWGCFTRLNPDDTCPQPSVRSQHLRQTEVNLADFDTCAVEYAKAHQPLVKGKMLCAAFFADPPADSRDACQGDSGGPLTFDGPAGEHQIGVVSFGIGCAWPPFSGIYAQVSTYHDWIRYQTLTGRRITPAAQSITFGSLVQVGTSATQSLRVTSTGVEPVEITGATATGDFVADTASCAGRALAPGESCDVQVTFRPTAAGMRTGSVTITDNGNPGTNTVPVIGAGFAPTPPPEPPPSPPTPPVATYSGQARIQVSRTGEVSAVVDCTGDPAQPCGGTATLSSQTRPGSSTVLGRTAYAIPAGRQTVRIQLNRAGRQALSHSSRVAATITLTGLNGITAQSPVTLVGARAPVATVQTSSIRLNRSGTGTVRVRCAARRGNRCTGAVRVSTSARGPFRPIASRSFSIAGGRTATVRLRFSRAVRERIRRAGRRGIRARAQARTTVPVGMPTARTRPVTLR